MRVAIIADDLTGAADTGVQLARAGYRTAVAFRGAPVPPAGGLDAVALDTDSRSLPPDLAAKRVLEAAGSVREARLFYKKIDSTLRGPLAAELAAALEATERNVAVVAPAFPAAGRTTVNGTQLVRGVPVHETEARSDPRTPVSEGHLPTLLAGTASVVTLGVDDLVDPANVRRALEGSDGPLCVVADAEHDEDLEALARAVPDPGRVLWVGSAGLASALGRVYPGPRAETAASASNTVRRVLVVVGSLSGVSRRQLRALQEYGCTVVAVAGYETMGGVISAVENALAESACAAVSSSDERGTADAEAVVEALSGVAAGLSEKGFFDALVLTGGDTAVGVARRLGAAGILLEGEVEAGMPVGSLIGPNPYRVVTKAGGFGENDTLTRVVETLLAGGKEREAWKHPS
jgi:D-threonate/D-erythronate kinase